MIVVVLVSCFKSSRAKRDKELEFMAINLHVQRLKVIRDSGRPGFCYCIFVCVFV